MRKTFEANLKIGQLPIEETPVPKKNRSGLGQMVEALLALYKNKEYLNRILKILETKVLQGKKSTGRTGMNLWQIFVLAEVRLTSNICYDDLFHIANFDKQIRQLMGVETNLCFEKEEYSYQTVIDNVSLIDEATARAINDIIVEFGEKKVFKKKETEALRLKTDSFVVESNVHFPTDYNLLLDCSRKSIDMLELFLDKYPQLEGWRKRNNWQKRIKNLSREFGKISASSGKGKEERMKKIAQEYISTAQQLHKKLQTTCKDLPINDEDDLRTLIQLEVYIELMLKHIDLVERRVIKGESIPHCEKMFSIFETYTEWIIKGKQRPAVELGKNVSVTSDQYHLILDYMIMDKISDSETVLPIADRVLAKYKNIGSWSYDRGYWNADNKAILQLEVQEVIMPKKGKCNAKEREDENRPLFKKLRNKHSAVESNINALGHRGLDRCPDRGYEHFKRYVGLAVCACNLCCIGRALAAQKLAKKKPLKAAA
jgi:hypothetical protein